MTSLPDPPVRRGLFAKTRVEAFSDGVFAIAIAPFLVIPVREIAHAVPRTARR